MPILPKLVEAPVLRDVIKKSVSSLKIIDCTYNLSAKPDLKEFRENFYGKFEEKLISKHSCSKDSYFAAHIPTAKFLDIDVAFYPTVYERFAAYPGKIFEEYAQLLELDSDDHLVFYGRGNPSATMIFPARVYWLFKSYGHTKLSLLNGGFNEWERNYFEIERSETNESPTKEHCRRGNWTAKEDGHLTLSYENVTIPNSDNKDILENVGKTNIVLDARKSGAFYGKEITGLPYTVKGSHLPGSINIPALELLNEDGKLKSENQIKRIMETANENTSTTLPIITICNVGMQASLLNFVLDSYSIETRLYPGGLFELSERDPSRISAGENL